MFWPAVQPLEDRTLLSGPPTVASHSYSITHDRALLANTLPSSVLYQDNDPNGYTLTALLDTGPAHGTLSLSSNGEFVYMPNPGWYGADSFIYHGFDGVDSSNTATATIAVNETAPVAGNASVSVAHDRSVAITPPVTDAENDSVALSVAANPLDGTVVANSNGTFTYTPNPHYFGTDSFTYSASDGILTSATSGTISITVNETAPVAQNGDYSTPANQTLDSTSTSVRSVQTFDTDAEGDALTSVLVSGPAHGSLAFNADGTFLYTPATGYTGLDSFTYYDTDGLERSNTNATVSILVGSASGLSSQGTTHLSTTEGTALSNATVLTVMGTPTAAEVRWGDGTESAGTVVSWQGGSYKVQGSHTYTAAGAYALAVIVLSSSSLLIDTADSTATVSDAALSLSGLSFSAFTSQSTPVEVATVTQSNAFEPPSDLSGTITWASGQTSTATITADPTAGTFDIYGMPPYASAGTYSNDSVQVTDQDGSISTASPPYATSNVTANPLAGSNVVPSAVEGNPFTGTVATFTDTPASSSAPASTILATITWGDGQTSLGQVIADPVVSGQYDVTGTHTYTSPGSYHVTVTVVDQNGARFSTAETMAVSDAPLTPTPISIGVTEDQLFAGTVGHFTDTDPNGTAANYWATIDWGDGQVTYGSIVANVAGGFDVTGTHAYTNRGPFTTSVAIHDVGGAFTTVSASVGVSVPPPLVTIAATQPNASEAGLTGVYTVTRTGDTTTPLAVNYTVTGTAVSGLDFQPLSGTVTIAAGASTATINLTAIDDNNPLEPSPENVYVTLDPSTTNPPAYTVNAQSLTATDTSSGGPSATQGQIVVSPQQPVAAASFALGGMPATATAGAAFSFTVTALDINGNVNPDYAGTVVFASNDTKALLPASYTFTTTDAGVHTFSVTLETAGPGHYVKVSDPVANGIAMLTTNPGPATKLKLANFPTPTQAGAAQSFTVTAQDAYGNTATGYTGTVHFTSSDTAAVLPANYTFATADAGLHTFTATLNTTGSTKRSMTATDTQTNTITGTESGITVNTAQTGTAAAFQVAGVPDSVTAGSPFNVTVTVVTATGAVVTGYIGTVHFTLSDGAGMPPADYTFTAADAGVHTFSVTLATAGASSTIMASDTVTAGLAGVAGTNVLPGAASKLVVANVPSPVADGSAQTFTVTADDAYNNVATGYTGTVHFTSTDPLAVLPADYTFTSTDAGIHAFTVTFHSAGTWSLTATDLGANGVAASTKGSIVATAPAAPVLASIRVAGFPQSIAAGQTATVRVSALDAAGNVLAGYRGTVHFTSSDLLAALPADYTFTGTDAGTHVFKAMMATVGTQSLTARDAAANLSGTETGIVVAAAPADPAAALQLSGLPATTTAGSVFTVTVTAVDVHGAIATGYTGTIHFTTTSSSSALPSDYTFTTGTNGDNGTHTFNVTLKGAGAGKNLEVVDTVSTGLQAIATTNIVPAAATKLILSNFPSPVQVGAAQNFWVYAQDAYGNRVTGYTGTVHFTSSETAAVLPADYTFTAADGGSHVFTATLKTIDTRTISDADTQAPSIKGSEGGIAVQAVQSGVAASLQLAGVPASPTAGSAFNVTVKALLADGVTTATGYTGTVHFSSSDTSAVLPADYTFKADDAGVHTFSVSFKTASPGQSLKVADTGGSGKDSTPVPGLAGFTTANVVPAAPSLIPFSTAPSPVTAGTPQTTAVTVQDAYHNVETGYIGTLHFTSSDTAAVLPGDYSFTAADAGAHTFTYTLKTLGNDSVTAADSVNNLSGTFHVNPVNAVALDSGTLGLLASMTACTAYSLTVSARDAGNNVMPSYRGTVHFTSSDPLAQLPADYTFTAADAGTHTFSMELITCGTQSVAVTDIASGLLVSQAGINVATTQGDTLHVVYPSTTTAGVSNSFTVSLRDGSGALVTGYRGTVQFSSTDPLATLPVTYTFTAADGGTHTFAATFDSAGTQSLTALDSTLCADGDGPGMAGTQTGILVQPGQANVLAVTAYPSPVIAGTAQRFVVTAYANIYDSNGHFVASNVATGYTGTVHFSSTDQAAGLPADYPFTAADAGVHVFTATFWTPNAGSYGLVNILEADPYANFLQGTVYDDANGNNTLDSSDTPIADATVQLYKSDGVTLLGTTTSDASGSYLFTSLNVAGGSLLPGSYRVVEVPPAGYNPTGVQSTSTFDTSTVLTSSSIQVALPTLTQASLNFVSTGAGESVTLTANGSNVNAFAGLLNLKLLQAGSTVATLAGNCVALLQTVSVGSTFNVTPRPASGIPLNGGEIAWLLDHVVPPDNDHAAGLQLAIWKLELDPIGTPFTSGVLQASTPGVTANALADAQAYLTQVGSQTAVAGFFDASNVALANTASHYQSMVATDSFNFGNVAGNQPISSLTGTVYIDAANTHAPSKTQPVLPGVTVILSGTNDLGQAVGAKALTNSDGLYSFEQLRPGTYTVTALAPTGFVDVGPTAGSAGGTAGHDTVTGITLGLGIRATGYNFAWERPPAFVSAPITIVAAGGSYVYRAHATDPDSGDTLTYTLLQPLPGTTSLSVNAATGVVTWSPATADAGAHPIRLQVSDGRGGLATQANMLTVDTGQPNRPPIFTSTPPLTAYLGQQYVYPATAYDPDASETLTFSIVPGHAPAGLAVNASTGIVTWTPTGAQAGSDSVTLQVSDGTLVATQSFTIVVCSMAIPNRPPSFTSAPVVGAFASQPYLYQAIATDPDGGQALSYTVMPGSPPGLAIDGATGLVSWPNPQGSSATVTLQANDGHGGLATQSFTISVSATVPDRPPLFTSTPGLVADAGQPYTYQAAASDSDSGQTLTFSRVAGPSGLTVSSAGLVSWPSPQVGTTGSATVSLQVSDGTLTTVQTYTLVVLEAVPDSPPVFTSVPVVTATMGLPYSYQAAVYDPDAGDNPTVILLSPQNVSGLSCTSAGLLTWTNPQPGSTTISLQVSDGRGDTALQTFTLAVNVATPDTPPTVTSSPGAVAYAGQPYSYQPTAVDPDPGQTLTWSIGSPPVGMQVDPNTGLVSWSPSNYQSTHPGYFNIMLSVSDGHGGTCNQNYTLLVGGAPPVAPPLFTSTPVLSSYVGQAYLYQPTVTDPNMGVRLVYSSTTPGITVNPTTGLVSWANPTSTTIQLQVTDCFGGTAVQSYPLAVSSGVADRPPVFTSAPVISVAGGEPYDYLATAADPDSGQTLTFSVVSGPKGLTIDPQSGLVTWTAPEVQTGSYPVTLQVSDGHGGTATQGYAIVLTTCMPDDAIAITSTPVTYATVNQVYIYNVRAEDAASVPITYSLPANSGNPSGMAINPATGQITWTPTVALAQPITITLTATDTLGSSTTQSYSLTVSDNNTLEGRKFTELPAGTSAPTPPDAGTTPNALTPVTLVPIAQGLNYGQDLDYDAATGSIIAAVNGFGGSGGATFEQVLPNGTLAPFGGTATFSGGEVSLTSAQPGDLTNFPLDDVFAAAPQAPRQIALLENGGSTVIVDWVTIPGEGGGISDLAIDETGQFGGDLIAGTSAGDVWTITPQKTCIELATGLGPIEGLEVVPNNPARYGPLAGTVLAGNADFAGSHIYAISATRTVTTYTLGLPSDIEDITVVPANTNFYGLDIGASTLYGVGSAQLAGLAGEIVVEVEGENNGIVNGTTGLYRLHWDGAQVETTPVKLTAGSPHPGQWEAGVFTSAPFGTIMRGQPTEGLPNWTINLKNNGGTVVATTTTDALGNYAFTNVSSGTYTVAEVPQTGWTQFYPAAQEYQVSLTSDQTVANLDFGNTLTSPPTVDPGPVFGPPPTQGGTVDQPYTATVSAADADHDPITYSPGLTPAGMTIDPLTGVIHWTPNLTQVGFNNVIVRADDGQGNMTPLSFSIAVSPTDLAPVILSQPVLQAYPDQTYRYQVDAFDPDGEGVTYSVSSTPTETNLQIGATGLLTWTTPPLGADPQITITVKDHPSAPGTTQVFYLPVGSHSGNGLPTFTSTAPTAVQLGQVFYYLPTATDSDGDNVTLALGTGNPAGVVMDATGLVHWDTSQNGIQASWYHIYVKATDTAGNVLTQDSKINVADPLVIGPPTITSTPPQYAVVGDLYRYNLTATDPQNELMAWKLDNGPAGMALDPLSNTLIWTPTDNQVGVQSATVEVDDTSGGQAGQSFNINVLASDDPPVVTSEPPTTVSSSAPTYTYQVVASDPDGAPVSYALTTTPSSTMTINPNTGLVQWPSPSGTSLAVSIQVTDLVGLTTTQNYTLNVVNGTSPAITSTPPTETAVGLTYSYTVVGSDPQNSPLTFTAPSGWTVTPINSTSATLTWTPSTADTTSVSIVATDGLGLQTTQTYSLEVLAAPPSFTAPYSFTVTAGQTFSDQVSASDTINDTFSYALQNPQPGMLVTSSGLVTWPTTGSNANNTYNFTVVATTPLALVASQAYSVTVVPDTTAPTVHVLISANPAPINTSVTFDVIASDNVGVAALSLTVGGQPVPLGANGLGTMTFTTPNINIAVVATATDYAGNVGTANATLAVVDPTDTSAPTVSIASPVDYNANPSPTNVVTAPMNVVGTASDPGNHLLGYTLDIAPLGSPTFTTIASGTAPVVGNNLGLLDPTTLADGPYTLRLTAWNAGGHVATTSIEVMVSGQLKLGNLHMSFTDLTVPVAGIPITITRTYDSLNANKLGDFGFGWTLSEGNYQLSVSLASSDQGQGAFGDAPPFRNGTRVLVTAPDGTVEAFTFAPIVTNSLFGIPLDYSPAFTPDPGVTDTLTVPPADLIYSASSNEYLAGDGTPYNPSNPEFGNAYTLTDFIGIARTIDATTGLLSTESDRHNNTLSFQPTGIFSNTGRNVTFQRDALGRITSITDPNGNSLIYTYSPAGDLVSMTDRDDNPNTFTYSAYQPHFLTQITDGLGRTVLTGQYDTAGRLTHFTDAQGDATTKGYNVTDPPAGSAATESAAAPGNTSPTTNTYDSEGLLLQSSDPLRNVTIYTYNGMFLASKTETVGGTYLVTRYTTNAFGEPLSETDPSGDTTHYSYDPYGLPISKSDGLGNTTYTSYDPNTGDLLSVTSPLGNVTSMSYDAAGDLWSTVSPAGKSTFTYDAYGDVQSSTDVHGTTTTNAYDHVGNKLTRSWTWLDPSTGSQQTLTTTNMYDGNGNLQQSAGPQGTSTTTYDADSQARTQTDALGGVTQTVYNGRGLPVMTTTPDGKITDTVYDAQGRVLYRDDPHLANEPADGTLTIYDQEGNVIGTERFANMVLTVNTNTNPPTSTESSLGTLLSSTATTFDALGRAVSSTAAAGLVTNTTYDAAGNVLKTTKVFGGTSRTMTSTYDVLGRVASTADSLGNTTHYQYNGLGEVTKNIFADGTSISDTYDSQGHKTSETDQNGLTTVYKYDPYGHLTAVVLPAALDPMSGVFINPTYRYIYDIYGNQATTNDPLGRVTTFGYDAFGHEVKQTLPLGQSESWGYNGLGELSSFTDFDGNVQTYDQYDTSGRVLSKSVYAFTNLTTPSWTVSYAYDTNVDSSGDYHNTVAISNGGGTTDSKYDVQGDLVQLSSAQGTISYQYDFATGRKIGESTSNTAIGYAYNAFGELTGVTVSELDGHALPQPLVTGYTYDANGSVVSTILPNGTTETLGYNNLNELTSIVTTGLSGTIAAFSYAYDAAGHRTLEVDSGGRKVLYAYDNLGRLVQEGITDPVAGDHTIAYQYDLAANRLSKCDTGAAANQQVLSYDYDVDDRLLAVTGSAGYSQAYRYDANGSTYTITGSGGAPSASYTWDAAGRLASAAADGAASSYRYDDDDNRLTSTTGAVTTTYLNDPNQAYDQILEEYSGGLLAATYVRGLNLLFQDRSGTPSYFAKDGLVSTRALTNSTGQVTDTFTYDAFGNLLARTGTTTTEFLFAGQQIDGFATQGPDSSIQQYYLRARYYAPATGAFASRDTFDGQIKNPISWNHYTYAGADPVDRTDPSGHDAFSLPEELSVTADQGLLAGIVLGSVAGAYLGSVLLPPVVQVAYNTVLWLADSADDGVRNLYNEILSDIEAAVKATEKAITAGLEGAVRWTLQQLQNLPPFFVLQVATPDIYNLDAKALVFNPWWHILSYNGPKSPKTDENRRIVFETYGYLLLDKPPGYSLDEFPYASTAQGGLGALADTVPLDQNSLQGVHLSLFYRFALRMRAGRPFLVVLLP
jgi:RHS repeat-associated protein